MRYVFPKSQAQQVRQQSRRTRSAPSIVGSEPMATKSDLMRPIIASLHRRGPTSITMALINTGISAATGVIEDTFISIPRDFICVMKDGKKFPFHQVTHHIFLNHKLPPETPYSAPCAAQVAA